MDGRDGDVWTYVHNSLSPIFGYKMSVESVQSIIHQGNYGIEGFCNWIEFSIINLGVEGAWLEGKLNTVLEAVNVLIPSSPCSSLGLNTDQNHAADINDPHKMIDINSSPPVTNCMSAGHLSSLFKLGFREIECLGYQLHFPDSELLLTLYAFAIHKNSHLHVTWSVSVMDNAITLRSHECSHNLIIPASDDDKPCTSCSNLHNNTIVMGIQHRSFDGVDESTPWSYLAHDHLTMLLQKKNKKIHQLQLNALNAACKLGVCNTQLEGWKRFSVAIGTHDIPRLWKLIASELKKGGSIFAILTKVDHAVQKNYYPRGYKRTDFERAYLIWKLGGVSAAKIAFCTMGLPSISATRRFIHISLLYASPSDPTTNKIEYNLKASFSGLPSLQAQQETPAALSNVYTGVVMAMDEIKLQERL
ncbi:hypothetical protein IW261DRAFT_1564148 [Armillaria novae-zelandiae]|uniref:Uncharacterized protein n=1 Tax=Armillaria novae-zelandiae TaxID=153914 RepID=A0AA39UHW0_9AGAR|nr:hypothetical protein IW261DRAFT_1564148 [Armillaria novae-zelandiae]